MWSNKDNGQLEKYDQIEIKVTRKMLSNTDKCQLDRCNQTQINVNWKDVIKYR